MKKPDSSVNHFTDDDGTVYVEVPLCVCITMRSFAKRRMNDFRDIQQKRIIDKFGEENTTEKRKRMLHQADELEKFVEYMSQFEVNGTIKKENQK